MKTVLSRLVWQDDDNKIYENDVYVTTQNGIKTYWIVKYNMATVSFVLVCLNIPMTPVQPVAKIPFGDLEYDLFDHAGDLVGEHDFLNGPTNDIVENIEYVLKTQGFSLYS